MAAASHRGTHCGRRAPPLSVATFWAESAFSYANLECGDTTKVKGRAFDEASTSATRAISLKPGNSGVWLMPADAFSTAAT